MIIDKCYKIDIKLHKIRCLYNLHYLFSKNKTNPLRDISTFVVQYTSDAIWNNAIGDFEFKNMKQKKKKIYEWIVKYRVRFEIFWIIFFRLLHGDYSSCWCSCEVQSEIKRTLNILWAYHYILVDTVLIFLWALFCLCICYETCRYCDRWRY